MGLVRVVRRHLLPETVIRGGRSLSGGFGDLLLKHTTRLRSLVLRDQCKRLVQFRKELSALNRGDRFRPGREQTYREHLVPSGLRGGEGKMQRIQARDSHRQACPFCFLDICPYLVPSNFGFFRIDLWDFTKQEKLPVKNFKYNVYTYKQ